MTSHAACDNTPLEELEANEAEVLPKEPGGDCCATTVVSLLRYLFAQTRFLFSQTRSSATAFSLLVLALGLLLGPAGVRAQSNNNLIPPSGTQAARDLQSALDRAGCYPPATPTSARTDGLFGALGTNTFSRRAVDNWLSAKGVSETAYLSSQQLLSDVRNSGLKCPVGGSGSCRRDSIGAEYLSGLKGIDDVRRLSIALQTAIANFDKPETSDQTAVFPVGGGDPVTLSPQNLERVKEFGVEGVTPLTTLSALKGAAHNFNNLVLSFALKAPACRNCAKINDWLYLRNIASANSGILIGMSPTTDIFTSFNVNDVPEDLMDKVRSNIYVFRSITAKLNQVLAAGADPVETRKLIRQRNAELNGIVAHFSATAKNSTARKMSALAASSKCIGFTGSAIYQ